MLKTFAKKKLFVIMLLAIVFASLGVFQYMTYAVLPTHSYSRFHEPIDNALCGWDYGEVLMCTVAPDEAITDGTYLDVHAYTYGGCWAFQTATLQGTGETRITTNTLISNDVANSQLRIWTGYYVPSGKQLNLYMASNNSIYSDYVSGYWYR